VKYFHLILGALFRRKTRTIFTLLSVLAAFLLFGLLDSVRSAFANAASDIAGVDRLVTMSKISFTLSLPKSLLDRIAEIPGVSEVTYANWFGGVYQDPKDFFANEAVAPNFLDLYPEWQLSAAERAAFRNTRTGAVVGERLAKRFHWRVGDKVPLEATIFPQKNGSNTWTFDLVGLFREADPKQKDQEDALYFNWDYFDEARAFGNGNVGWYVTRVSDRNAAKTQTEQSFQAQFVSQFADVGLIVGAIMGAVFFTLVLLTGNTMAQAVRERIPELAVLKTIGFSNRSVLFLVLVESVLLIVLGGAIGLVLAGIAVEQLAATIGGKLPLTPVGLEIWLRGLVLMVLIGLLVGALPARRGMRLRIVDALAGR
jgi:putative ABC transport system permease protein